MADNTDKKRKPNAGQWKPGQTGNPCGRPPNPLRKTKALREIGEKKASTFAWSKDMAEMIGLDPKKITVCELSAHYSYVHAALGKSGFEGEINARLDGKVKEQLEVSTAPQPGWGVDDFEVEETSKPVVDKKDTDIDKREG